MKQIIKKIPVIGSIARHIYSIYINHFYRFPGSESYWKTRYNKGGNSGAGSYNHLAEFKAEILNKFVLENGITSVIEYGCGDGNQLKLSKYPKYIGFDVSQKALSICMESFSNDSTKIFKLMEAYAGETAELTLSLDVIYHLIEDDIYTNYMNRLFDSSKNFVVIYSSDNDKNLTGLAAHIKQRNFSKWIKVNREDWQLLSHIPNRYPMIRNDYKNGSFADFFIYQRRDKKLQ